MATAVGDVMVVVGGKGTMRIDNFQKMRVLEEEVKDELYALEASSVTSLQFTDYNPLLRSFHNISIHNSLISSLVSLASY